MNDKEHFYTRFSLVKEMMDTASVIGTFDTSEFDDLSIDSDSVLLTGEGSSRIFPAKRIASLAGFRGYRQSVMAEGALQACEYQLDGRHLFVASNSGKTAEAVQLLRRIRGQESEGKSEGSHTRPGKPAQITGIVGEDGTPIAGLSDRHYVLRCGREDAVAASKSVVEQALVYETLFRKANGDAEADLDSLSRAFEDMLTAPVDADIIEALASSPIIYFAGRNDGVAEELTLKTNEITRLKSSYLEGTYAVHGIEEVMHPNETVVIIEPFEEQEEKFFEVLRDGVGMKVVAVSRRETAFPTIRIPDLGDLNPYLLLAAGWSMLVEVGLRLEIDIDKPMRARKVGNEYTEQAAT